MRISSPVPSVSLGFDEAEGNHVDGDATAGHLDRDGLGHADQAGLRGRIVGLSGLARGPTIEATLMILPKRAPEHRWRCPARARKAVEGWSSMTPVPLVVADLRRGAIGPAAGVVDQAEDGAERSSSPVKTARSVGIGEVGGDGDCRPTGLADPRADPSAPRGRSGS